MRRLKEKERWRENENRKEERKRETKTGGQSEREQHRGTGGDYGVRSQGKAGPMFGSSPPLAGQTVQFRTGSKLFISRRVRRALNGN